MNQGQGPSWGSGKEPGPGLRQDDDVRTKFIQGTGSEMEWGDKLQHRSSGFIQEMNYHSIGLRSTQEAGSVGSTMALLGQTPISPG